MLARLKSEVAYGLGLWRGLSRTAPVAANPNRTAADYLETWAKTFADRTALVDAQGSLSYAELNRRASKYARWAQSIGLVKGDVVALLMPNRADYLAIWFGMARAGVATALLNTNLGGHALAHGVNIVDAKAILVDSSLSEPLAGARAFLKSSPMVFIHGEDAGSEPRIDTIVDALDDAPFAPETPLGLTIDDTALFIYTSGTTGLPKAARITHSRLLRAMLGFSGAAGARADDRMYQCLPMYHTNGGVVGPGIVLSVGGACVIRERFSASEFWPDAIASRCTMFIYVGELCRYLFNCPPSELDRAHAIRLCIGNGLRPDIFADFRARFGIRDIREFYAATEGNAVLFNFDSYPGAVGRLPGWAAKRFPIKLVRYDVAEGSEVRDSDGRFVECAIGEPGELISEIRNDPKTPAARFDGYADPAATRQKIIRDAFHDGDAWFRTGDLLTRDARGYFYFVDRIGDTYRWKGENVSTTEVAEAIMAFPGVVEAIVYGVAAPGHEGRAGMAAIVAEAIAEFDLVGLRAHLANRLPGYARPVFLRFMPRLDLTGTFKPKKMTLVAEGFDVSRISDPVFVDLRTEGYLRVDPDLAARLSAGAVKL
jgi:fatty-acyl-CoA synthase